MFMYLLNLYFLNFDCASKNKMKMVIKITTIVLIKIKLKLKILNYMNVKIK
jgi:hypothetical protein